MVIWLHPYQRATYSGRVLASYTSRAGASNSRVIRTSVSDMIVISARRRCGAFVVGVVVGAVVIVVMGGLLLPRGTSTPRAARPGDRSGRSSTPRIAATTRGWARAPDR